HRYFADTDTTHLARRLLGGGRVPRQQGGGDPVLIGEQDERSVVIGGGCECCVETFPERRQRSDHSIAPLLQRRNLREGGAIVRQPRNDAVDHVLLVKRKLGPRFLEQFCQRRGRRAYAVGLRALFRQEVARGKPKLVHAAVDLLGEIADPLQPLQ